MLDKFPDEVLLHVYNYTINYDKEHLLDINWGLVKCYWFNFMLLTKDISRIFSSSLGAKLLCSMARVRVKIRVSRCTDEFNETTDNPERSYSYLYGPIFAGDVIRRDEINLPPPDIVSICQLNRTLKYVDKIIEYITLCMPIGVPFSMSESDIAHCVINKYKTIGNMLTSPKEIIHNSNVVGDCNYRYVCLYVYKEMTSSFDDDIYSHFKYILLVEDESMKKINERILNEFGVKYFDYEFECLYTLDMNDSLGNFQHMIGFDEESYRIDSNTRCVFPILTNCSGYCPNCVTDDDSDDIRGRTLVWGTDTDESEVDAERDVEDDDDYSHVADSM